MKRNVLIIIVLIISWINTINAQKILTLKECYDQAMASNALAGEKK